MSDVFVAYPPSTTRCVIFGKNADRPPTEVQEVVYFPAKDHALDSKIMCTLVEMDQVSATHAVVLSKSAWTWGAEMGANDKGLCIGCTAVWTKLCHPGDHSAKLMGVDYVRLGLERCSTSKEALDTITELLDKHGQCGLTSQDHSFGQWSYNTSFIFVDLKEAWLLETAGEFWAAKHISDGHFNVSSCLRIADDYDKRSPGLVEKATEAGHWKAGNGSFNFSQAFAAEFDGLSLTDIQKPQHRQAEGEKLMTNMSKDGSFNMECMREVLRDEGSSINFMGELYTVGSQISVLSLDVNIPHCHWFTATPNPSLSVFKPFIFCSSVDIGEVTRSPATGERARASFQTNVDRRHPLFIGHEKARPLMESDDPIGQRLLSTMQQLEQNCITEMQEFLQSFSESNLNDVQDLFKDISESETKCYK
ncbi:secernin-3-like isoform X2 [Mytilus edulis]|uniref:secernin-3-like isoform X2 n=1 Tax=Mytilus edulis TaxID=6550 RepID=UPI0039F0AB2F